MLIFWIVFMLGVILKPLTDGNAKYEDEPVHEMRKILQVNANAWRHRENYSKFKVCFVSGAASNPALETVSQELIQLFGEHGMNTHKNGSLIS